MIDVVQFTIVFAKMLFTILREYFVKCTRLDKKIQYNKEIIN